MALLQVLPVDQVSWIAICFKCIWIQCLFFALHSGAAASGAGTMPAIELEPDSMGGTGGTLPAENDAEEEEEQQDDSPSNID